MPTVYIYGLLDPRTGLIRYIGKTNNPLTRLRAHLTPATLRTPTHKNRWVAHLKSFHLRPRMVILEECTRATWEEREIAYIAEYRLYPGQLTNASAGGGATRGNTGHPMKPETRERLSALNRGKKHSPEVRARQGRSVRENFRRNGHPHKGKKFAPQTPEMRAAKSARMKLSGPSPIFLQAAHDANRGRKQSAEHKAKVLAATEAYRASPKSHTDAIARGHAGGHPKGQPLSDEHRAKVSASIKKHWETRRRTPT